MSPAYAATSINRKYLPGYVRCVSDEKENGGGNIFRSAGALKRNLADDILLHVFRHSGLGPHDGAG